MSAPEEVSMQPVAPPLEGHSDTPLPEAITEKTPTSGSKQDGPTTMLEKTAPDQVPAPTSRQPIPWNLKLNAVLIVLVCLPWLYLHGSRLWASAHYSFFPIVLLGSAVLAVNGWKGIGQLEPGSAVGTWVLLGLSFVLLFVAGVPLSPMIGTVATLFLLLAVIWALGGPTLLRRMLPAWIFLWLAIPPPLNLDTTLINGLQSLTARATSKLLDLFRVIHVMAGNVVEVPGKRLLVEEACSGIHSLFSVVTCVLFFILWSRPSIPRSIFLVMASLFWVVLNNTTRVVTIVLVYTRWGINLSEGWVHDLLGWVLFAITLGLIASSDRLYLFFASALPFRSRVAQTAAPTEGPTTRLPDLRLLRLGAVPITAALAVLVVLQTGLFVVSASDLTPAHDVIIQRLDVANADTMPARIGPWQRGAFDNKALKVLEAVKAVKSRTWTYQMGSLKAILSLDYPFTGWHELPICYQGQGWTLQDRILHPVADPPGSGGYLEQKLQKPLDRSGYLFFGLIDQQGDLLDPPEHVWAQQMGERGKPYQKLWQRLTGMGGSQGVQGNRSTCQVQVFVESYQPLTPAEIAQVQNLYVTSRNTLRKLLQTEPAQ
jgi:exosortase